MNLLRRFIESRNDAAARQLRDAYRTVFGSEMAKRVLQDLAEECCMTDSPAPEDADPNVTLIKVGRQEVYQHIMRMMRLPDEAITQQIEQIYDRERSDYYGTD